MTQPTARHLKLLRSLGARQAAYRSALDEYERVFAACVKEGIPQATIALELGISRQAVHQQVNAAIRRLNTAALQARDKGQGTLL